MTLGTMEYFARDLYQKMPEEMRDIKLKVESLIENIITLREECDYTFSDIFKYKDGKLQIVLPSLLSTTEALRKIKEYYNLLQEMIQAWKLIRK
jgi:predicted metal-dependent hydrolase